MESFRRRFAAALRDPTWFVVGATVAIATLLCTYQLGSRPLWFDEAFSYQVARAEIPALLKTVVVGDPSMGLYYLLLHVWLAFGHGEAAMRTLSVVAAVATIPFTFALGKKLAGSLVGVLGVIILTLNSFFVEQAQEARGYTLVMLVATISSLLLVRALENRDRRSWVLYGVTAALTVFAHAFGLFIIVAHGVAAVAFADPEGRRRNVKRSAVVLGVASVLALPILRVASGSTRYAFIGLPDRRTLQYQISLLLGQQRLLLLAGLFLICIAAAYFVRALRENDRVTARNYGILLAWFFVPLIGSLLASFVQPMFAPRYLTPCLPAAALLMAIGIAALRNKIAIVLVTGMLGAMGFIGILRWFDDQPFYKSRPWRTASRYVLNEAKPRDTILFDGSASAIPFAYYWRTSIAPPELQFPYLPPAADDGEADGVSHQAGMIAFEDRSPKPRRVWVIFSVGSFGSAVDQALVDYRLEKQSEFDSIHVLLYRLPSGSRR